MRPVLRAALILIAVLVPVSLGRAEEPTANRQPEVGYYPTAHDVAEKMLRLARVTAEDVVCDLGCGDGRIVVVAAKKFGCRALGYEIDPKWVRQARANVRAAGVEEKAEIRDQTMFAADLRDVTIVTLFLLPDLNRRLVPQLQTMKPGSHVITHEFDIDGYIADKELTYLSQDDDSEHLLYVYTIPLRKAPEKPAAARKP